MIEDGLAAGELLAVLGVPDGARRGDPDPLGPESPRTTAYVACQHNRRRCAPRRSDSIRPVRSTPSPEPRDDHVPGELRRIPPAPRLRPARRRGGEISSSSPSFDRGDAAGALLSMDRLDLLGDPDPDRIDAAGQVEGVVGVQALHAARRVPPTPPSSRASCRSARAIRGIGLPRAQRAGQRRTLEFVRSRSLDRAMAPAASMRATALVAVGARQPVCRGEGRAVGTTGSVADHQRMPTRAARHDRERHRGLASELLAHRHQVGRAELSVRRCGTVYRMLILAGATGDADRQDSVRCRPMPGSPTYAGAGADPAVPSRGRGAVRRVSGGSRTSPVTRAGTRSRSRTRCVHRRAGGGRPWHAWRVVPVRGRGPSTTSSSVTSRSAWSPTTLARGARVHAVARPSGEGIRDRSGHARDRLRVRTPGRRAVFAIADARNDASIALLERIGMRRTTTEHVRFKEEWCDEHTYELRREEG